VLKVYKKKVGIGDQNSLIHLGITFTRFVSVSEMDFDEIGARKFPVMNVKKF